MEYKVNELAKLAGVSARTLRYYDEIGLLHPARGAENGYRVYGPEQVDRLQQILFYRALGLELEEIGRILDAPDFDRTAALREHLAALKEKQKQIGVLIQNVEKTLSAAKGETTMTDSEKFQGFKQKMLEENEQKYGAEVREKYGREAYEASRERVSGMSYEVWQEQQAREEKMFALLRAAMEKGDPTCPEAQQAADLHRQWLSLWWKKGTYSKQAHAALAQGYVADERFTAYYDERLGKGGTQFLRDAIVKYAQE